MINVASEAMGVVPEDLRDNSLLRLNRTQFQKSGDSPLLLTFFIFFCREISLRYAQAN